MHLHIDIKLWRSDLIWLVGWLVDCSIYTAALPNQWNFFFFEILSRTKRRRGRRIEQTQWIQFHKVCITHSMHNFWYRTTLFMLLSHICTHHLQPSPPIEINAARFILETRWTALKSHCVYAATLPNGIFAIFKAKKKVTNASWLFTLFGTRAKIKSHYIGHEVHVIRCNTLPLFLARSLYLSLSVCCCSGHWWIGKE